VNSGSDRLVRVGIDVAGALRPDTGVGRYTSELVRALSEVGPGLELVLFCNVFRLRTGNPALNLPGRLVNPGIPARFLQAAWGRLGWPPIETFIGAVDVFHASDWVHPPRRQGATVTTVHDVGALVRPEWYAPEVASIHRQKNQAAADKAALIITDSEFTRGEFLRLHAVEPDRVRVVHAGVSKAFRAGDPEQAAATACRFGLKTPFLLYVGTWERRKNVTGLIEIFARVNERCPEVKLAIVGMRPWIEGREVHGVECWSGQEVENRIRKLGVAGQIRMLGSVSLRELVDLYTAAELFVFPTYYEGFGLPALEAMACGLPVVASATSALPEVVGDAGVLAEPDDHDGFARAVLQLLGDSRLGRQCRTRGLERASRFTWQDTARGTLRVYEEAYQIS